MNTYIQNKLDEFDKRFSEEIILDQEVRTVVPGIKHFIKQSLTDYHNHIVEKIEMLKRKNYNETAFMNHRNYYNDAHNEVLQGVINFLQDTNPKE